MVLRTKSIRASPSPEDGLRICVMRSYDQEKHPEYYGCDTWWQALAPPQALLEGYNLWKKDPEADDAISWDKYIEIYRAEVLEAKPMIVHHLAQMALKKTVTILCYEEDSSQCHRRLLAEECQLLRPGLEVILD